MMENSKEKYEPDMVDKEGTDIGKKRSIFSRIVAVVLLAVYAALLGIFIYMIITGSEYIMAMLFVLIIYPVVLYLILWLRRVFSKSST